MARSQKTEAAILPAQGKKMTFGDESDPEDDFDQAGPSSATGPARANGQSDYSDYSDEDEEDSDDDAPEALGVAAAKQSIADAEAELAR